MVPKSAKNAARMASQRKEHLAEEVVDDLGMPKQAQWTRC